MKKVSLMSDQELRNEVVRLRAEVKGFRFIIQRSRRLLLEGKSDAVFNYLTLVVASEGNDTKEALK